MAARWRWLQVWFLDFGRSRLGPTAEECEQELKELADLFPEWQQTTAPQAVRSMVVVVGGLSGRRVPCRPSAGASTAEVAC